MALANQADTVLGPNPFEEHWGGNRGAATDGLPGDDAAAASAVPGEEGQEQTGIDDSWLTEEERSALDPSDGTYQMLMRAFARRTTQPAEQGNQNDLAAQLEAMRLQQEFGAQQEEKTPASDSSLWDNFTPRTELPPELIDYREPILSLVKETANHVVGQLQQRAQVEEQRTQTRELRTRLQSEVSQLLTGEASNAFRQDMGAVMRAANTPAGKALLADSTVGVKGIWNLVRAQRGEAPYGAQATRPATRAFPGDKRTHQVERTVPSVTRSVPAASQLPEPKSTRDAVEQAFAEAVKQAAVRRV